MVPSFYKYRSACQVIYVGSLNHFVLLYAYSVNFKLDQANTKLNEQQLASLSSPKAVNTYLENQEENITNVIKQNLAVGDIFKRENLQVCNNCWTHLYLYTLPGSAR